jgi:hypothetical protein
MPLATPALVFNTADAANRPGVDTARPVISGVVFAPTSGVLRIGSSTTATITVAGAETGLTASSTGLIINGKNVAGNFRRNRRRPISCYLYRSAEGDNDILEMLMICQSAYLWSILSAIRPPLLQQLIAAGRPGVDAASASCF